MQDPESAFSVDSGSSQKRSVRALKTSSSPLSPSMGDNGIQPRFSSKRIDNILTGTFILVVEDCPVQRKFVVNLLSTFPVTAVAVDCAEAAIEVSIRHT